jgi:hypothetical protein
MKKMSSSLLSRFAAALSLCLSFGLAHAQTDAPPGADPPDRVARLSFLQGEVSLQPAGEEEWANAVVNRPLTTGDKLWTDENARAEIQVGPAAVRLGSNTGFSFLNVDDNTIQMRMTAGIVNVRVRALDGNDQIEIDTPNLALSLLRPGNYRVEVNDVGDATVVKVSEGEAEATGGSQDVVVHAQQAATFTGTNQVDAQFASLGAPDAFDSWSLERDRRAQRAASSETARYVAPAVTGYEDLDANGTWISDPEYGYVWTPTTVAVGWAPYRYGRWVWVAPWGWTWVDDAPWGFAPFHYGRWAYVRSRWCWVPGPIVARPVYAPALVGWVGTPGVSVTISFGGGGGVAWFPLGPREVYVPARRFSPTYVERVNVTNTVIVNKTYITNVYENKVTNITYRNRTVPGAVTAVSRTTFTSAEPVGRHTVRIDEREITRVQASPLPPHIQPVRESRMGVSDAARRNVRMPPATIVNRQVVVKREPPPVAASFARNVVRPENQADRLHRLQDRNEAAGRNWPNVGNSADVRNDVRADSRNEANRPGRANGQPGSDANRDAAVAAERNRAQEERNARNAQDERPPQSRLRTDRPPSVPDHINRAPSNPQSDQPRNDVVRSPRTDRPPSADRLQQERQQEQQREQQARQQQQIQERQARQEQEREQQVRQQMEQQREQQARQQMEQQREQQARQQMEQQRLQQQRDREAQAAQRAQMDARREEAQRQQAASQQAERMAQREHANRPEPQRQPENKPQREEHERRRPDQADRPQ